MKKVVFFSFTILLFFSCQKDVPFVESPDNQSIIENPDVQSELQEYFNRFESAAQERGIDIQLSTLNLTGRIEEIDEDQVAGQCSYGFGHPSDVVIDASFWNIANDWLKEMVVFHELGHCVLFRGHEEAQFPNGACRSIMRSGIEGCFDNYNTQTRELYVDELFDGADF